MVIEEVVQEALLEALVHLVRVRALVGLAEEVLEVEEPQVLGRR